MVFQRLGFICGNSARHWRQDAQRRLCSLMPGTDTANLGPGTYCFSAWASPESTRRRPEVTNVQRTVFLIQGGSPASICHGAVCPEMCSLSRATERRGSRSASLCSPGRAPLLRVCWDRGLGWVGSADSLGQCRPHAGVWLHCSPEDSGA